MGKIAKRIIFIGRVQGVGFRFTSLRMANLYSLTGFVRNLPNGNVEMVAQGDSKSIDSCIEGILDSFSSNIKTEINEIPFNPKYSDFKITF